MIDNIISPLEGDRIPYHVHNRVDAPPVDYNDLVNKPTATGSGFLPCSIVSTSFETSGRFNLATSVAGQPFFGNSGMQISLPNTANNYASTQWTLNEYGGPDNIFSGLPTLTTEMMMYTFGNSASGVYPEVYIGLGEITLGPSGHSWADNHAGFKLQAIIGGGGGVVALYATQADGTTESTVQITGNLASRTKPLSLCISVGASSVSYYYKQGNNAWSSAVTISTNMPVLTTSQYAAQFSLAAPQGSGVTQDIRFHGATFIR